MTIQVFCFSRNKKLSKIENLYDFSLQHISLFVYLHINVWTTDHCTNNLIIMNSDVDRRYLDQLDLDNGCTAV